MKMKNSKAKMKETMTIRTLALATAGILGLCGLTGCNKPLETTQPPEATPTPTPASTPTATPAPTVAPVTTAPANATVPAAPAAPTPNPASGATAEALRLYPDLGKKDSIFNRTFRDLYVQKKNTELQSLTSFDWPLKLARETARTSQCPTRGGTDLAHPASHPICAGHRHAHAYELA
ncbi:MAG: hypothetical protein QM796_04320 [Chthoniobacteraceae bacterium]